MLFARRRCLAILCAAPYSVAKPGLLEEWRRIAMQTDGTVGASALHLESGRGASLHGGERFPLASVCKLPIAIHILAMADEGKLSLDNDIDVLLQDVVPGISDVAELWPRQKRFRLDELLRLMVARSDNTAVQTLWRIGGGSRAIAVRFRQWKIDGMRLDRSERECNLDSAGVLGIPPAPEWTPGMFDELTAAIPPAERLSAMRWFLADPRDTSTPDATVRLLERTFRGELLSAPSTAFLIKILESTTTGKARIKGLLPQGTVLAHKTGTTFTVMGFTGATNDAGVIDGKIAIAVYIKGSTRDQATRELIIAKIARAAFDSLRLRA